MRRPHRSPRLAALCLQASTTESTKDNIERSAIVTEMIALLRQHPEWHPLDAILLPGGFFQLSRALGASSFAHRKQLVERERFVAAIANDLETLQSFSPKVRLVTGIMATPRHKRERTEQACLAFDTTGLIAAARKLFPTNAETRGRRYMSPCLDDYRAKERFVSLPNGSLALLNSCYDLFGTADVGMAGGARRLAIRAVRQGSEQVTERDEGFRALRDGGLAAWAEMLTEQKPDVLLASVHAFQRPGLDGYWQRHGIARASASFNGALTVGAAHFLEGLPREGSTLAAYGVPKRALTAGVGRRAYSLSPVRSLAFTAQDGTPALLRLFKPPSGKTLGPRS
jgi:predicted amidohydrolase